MSLSDNPIGQRLTQRTLEELAISELMTASGRTARRVSRSSLHHLAGREHLAWLPR